MSNYTVNNSFHIVGNGNSVNIHQEFIDTGGEAMAQAVGYICKLFFTILLAPITIPFLLLFCRNAGEDTDIGQLE